MDVAGFRDWLERYFAAWVSNDPNDVAALFTADATYSVGPFVEPWAGRDEIVRRWTGGVQEDVSSRFEILAVSGELGIAQWNVTAHTPGEERGVERDGILLITFAPDGRCADHREWQTFRELPSA